MVFKTTAIGRSAILPQEQRRYFQRQEPVNRQYDPAKERRKPPAEHPMAALPPRPGAGTRFYPPAISEKNNSLLFSMPVSSFGKGYPAKKPVKFLTNPAVMKLLYPSCPLGNTVELVQ
jgi:hypothetical protein